MSLSDIRLNAGTNLKKMPERDRKAVEEFIEKDPIGTSAAVDIFHAQMKCFLFEAVIRPMDNALVIHLKHLPPALRNRKFFDYAARIIRDKIGGFESFHASFIGEVDSANKLNSLDLIFTKYYPALKGDMEFIKNHTAKIGYDLDEELVRELGDLASGNKA
jgi:hypothetical protein